MEKVIDIGNRMRYIFQCDMCESLLTKPRIYACQHLICSICFLKLKILERHKCPKCEKYDNSNISSPLYIDIISKILQLKDSIELDINNAKIPTSKNEKQICNDHINILIEKNINSDNSLELDNVSTIKSCISSSVTSQINNVFLSNVVNSQLVNDLESISSKKLCEDINHKFEQEKSFDVIDLKEPCSLKIDNRFSLFKKAYYKPLTLIIKNQKSINKSKISFAARFQKRHATTKNALLKNVLKPQINYTYKSISRQALHDNKTMRDNVYFSNKNIKKKLEYRTKIKNEQEIKLNVKSNNLKSLNKINKPNNIILNSVQDYNNSSNVNLIMLSKNNINNQKDNIIDVISNQYAEQINRDNLPSCENIFENIAMPKINNNSSINILNLENISENCYKEKNLLMDINIKAKGINYNSINNQCTSSTNIIDEIKLQSIKESLMINSDHSVIPDLTEHDDTLLKNQCQINVCNFVKDNSNDSFHDDRGLKEATSFQDIRSRRSSSNYSIEILTSQQMMDLENDVANMEAEIAKIEKELSAKIQTDNMQDSLIENNSDSNQGIYSMNKNNLVINKIYDEVYNLKNYNENKPKLMNNNINEKKETTNLITVNNIQFKTNCKTTSNDMFIEPMDNDILIASDSFEKQIINEMNKGECLTTSFLNSKKIDECINENNRNHISNECKNSKTDSMHLKEEFIGSDLNYNPEVFANNNIKKLSSNNIVFQISKENISNLIDNISEDIPAIETYGLDIDNDYLIKKQKRYNVFDSDDESSNKVTILDEKAPKEYNGITNKNRTFVYIKNSKEKLNDNKILSNIMHCNNDDVKKIDENKITHQMTKNLGDNKLKSVYLNTDSFLVEDIIKNSYDSDSYKNNVHLDGDQSIKPICSSDDDLFVSENSSYTKNITFNKNDNASNDKIFEINHNMKPIEHEPNDNLNTNLIENSRFLHNGSFSKSLCVENSGNIFNNPRPVDISLNIDNTITNYMHNIPRNTNNIALNYDINKNHEKQILNSNSLLERNISLEIKNAVIINDESLKDKINNDCNKVNNNLCNDISSKNLSIPIDINSIQVLNKTQTKLDDHSINSLNSDPIKNVLSDAVFLKFPNRSEWCFVISGITCINLKNQINSFCKLLQCKMDNKFSSIVTHVLVKPVDKGVLKCQRTLKYFQGIVNRCWVLSFEWVTESLSRDQLLPEEDFEIIGDTSTDVDHFGPMNARLSIAKLFNKYEICCLGAFEDLSRDDLRQLVDSCGGIGLRDPGRFSNDQSKIKVIVVEALQINSISESLYEKLFRQFKVPIVAKEWILDSIGTYDVKTLSIYTVYHFGCSLVC